MAPNDLVCDENVQRRFDPAHAKKMAAEFDPARFGLGHLSHRKDGSYHVLDGQHRRAAAVQAGYGATLFLFRVYRGLTEKQEADIFEKLQRLRKPVHALDMFRMRLKAGDRDHLEVERILASYGLRVAGYRTDGGIAAVQALLDIYAGRLSRGAHADGAPGIAGGDLLSRTLNVLCKAWGTNREAYDVVLLKGVAALLLKHNTKVDAGALAKALAKNPPAIVLVNINGLRQLTKKSSIVAAIEHLEGVYNYGRSESKRLQP